MSDKKSSGLGRGLAALLDEAVRTGGNKAEGDASAAPGTDARGVREVEIGLFRQHRAQPRVHVDEESIAELADSIAQRGVLQPILLRPDGENFQLVAGERRWRAAQRARLHAIPAIVREVDESSVAELALIENIQREDLNPLEEAEGYRQLIKQHGHTQDGVAALVHKSRSHVANLLRLLELPEFVRQSLLQGDISMGHARAVATAPDPVALTRQIIRTGMSVRQAVEQARVERQKPGAGAAIGQASARNAAKAANADIEALERQLADLLGLRVQVSHKGQGGAVTLHYSSLDQLDMICQRLTGEAI
jgi:ParB family chromosome partitioning protein